MASTMDLREDNNRYKPCTSDMMKEIRELRRITRTMKKEGCDFKQALEDHRRSADSDEGCHADE